MRVLLDTHLLLWAAGEPERLSEAARSWFENAENELMFSAASVWEAAIKSGLGRSDFVVDVKRWRRGLIDNGYQELPVTSQHAVAVGELPAVHRDPFDRMLLAQANVEGILLLTSDVLLARYQGPVRHV